MYFKKKKTKPGSITNYTETASWKGLTSLWFAAELWTMFCMWSVSFLLHLQLLGKPIQKRRSRWKGQKCRERVARCLR